MAKALQKVYWHKVSKKRNWEDEYKWSCSHPMKDETWGRLWIYYFPTFFSQFKKVPVPDLVSKQGYLSVIDFIYLLHLLYFLFLPTFWNTEFNDVLLDNDTFFFIDLSMEILYQNLHK